MISLWKFSESVLIDLYLDHNRSYLCKDLLVFTTSFLCKIKNTYYKGEGPKQIRYHCSYLNNKLHGVRKEWFDNGQLMIYDNMYNGKFHGECKEWHENGQIWCETNYVNGKRHSVWKEGCENGQIILQCSYINDKIHGKIKRWCEEGHFNFECNDKIKRRNKIRRLRRNKIKRLKRRDLGYVELKKMI